MSSPFFLSAPQLRVQGLSVIPLMPNSKRPAIEKWQEFCVNLADDETFKRWMRWKDMGIGVALGVASNLIGVDYDYDVDGLHKQIEALLPFSPVAKMGQKGCTRFYQYNGQKSQSFSKGGQRVLDILSVGRQTVLPPTVHPDTQKPYVWLTDKTLANFTASELPHVTLEAVYNIGKLITPEAVRLEHPRQVMVYDDSTKDEIAEAISYIPAEDYDVWVKIGMCLRQKFGESAFAIWDNWSSTSSKYKGTEMRNKWNSFQGQGLTIASLFYYAMDYGYVSAPASYQLEGGIDDFELNGRKTGGPMPKPEFVEPTAIAVAEPVRKTDLILFPPELLRAPGLPGILATFINKTSLMPQPILALGSAIAAAGALMGRKVRGDTGLRTNMYIIGLAPSGSGKDHARTVIKRLLHDTGLDKIELGVPASSAGLISSLREGGQCRGIILWDEFGRMLKQITGWKAGTHERDIVTALIELFSSSQSIYMGKAYANHDNKNPVKPIDQPCLSIYGTSVPSHFYDALSGSEAIDGFLSRWLIFESKDYTMEELDRTNSFIDIPAELMEVCKYWKEQPFNSEPDQGNLSDAMRVVPRLIKCSESANAHLKAFATETRKLAMQLELSGEPTGAIWSRAGEHARRLALVACEGDTVELKVAEWAVALARYCCTYMSNAIGDYVSSSELESQTKRILRAIKDKGRVSEGWVSRADLTRGFQGVPARTRNEILGSLIERGEITEEKMQSNGGRAKLRYRAL